MLGLFSAVVSVVGATSMIPALPIIAATVVTTGLFSGIMGIKREHHEATPAASAKTVKIGRSAEHAQGRGHELADNGIERRTDWAERAGRKMNSEDRASAIIAQREQAAGQANEL